MNMAFQMVNSLRILTALGICFIYVQITSGQLSPLSTFVAPVRIEIHKTNEHRNVTVRYQASSQPSIHWRVNTYEIYESNSDITLISDFSEITNSGFFVISMPIDHFYPDPPSKLEIDMLVDDFQFFLKFKTAVNILNSENFAYNVSPVYYDIGASTMLEYVHGEQLDINLSLRSADLNKYEVVRSNGRIDSFDYGVFPPEHIQRWSWTPQGITDFGDSNRDLKPFQCAGSYEDTNATSKLKQCSLNTTVDYVSGKGTFDLNLRSREDNPIVKEIYLFRSFYIKEVGQSAPYRENTLRLIRNSWFGVDSPEKRVTNSDPAFTYKAIGYPKPEIYLTRGCGNMVEPITATELGSHPYETTVKFTFPNISAQEKWETYVIHAKSGTFEISDFLSVERSRY